MTALGEDPASWDAAAIQRGGVVMARAQQATLSLPSPWESPTDSTGAFGASGATLPAGSRKDPQ